MKILHVVAGDLTGGAARGSYWLHQGLLNLGIDSHVLTSSKDFFADKTITSIVASPKGKILKLLRGRADSSMKGIYPQRRKVMFSTGLFGYDLTKAEAYKEADVIHLHWICDGFINIKQLYEVKKPIIWTMRDMWPMTGGCHYSIDCLNYKTGCGNCVQLGSHFKYDLSWLVLKRKENYLPDSIKLVGICNWLSEQAKTSYLFKDFYIETIHNNINASEFMPIERNLARLLLNISTNKKVILIGAAEFSSPYKGFDKFLEALKYISNESYYICFFGRIKPAILDGLGFEYKSLGYLHDNISLRLAYSCADVFVAPSLMEAFGKTLIESMACGTPVVCFDATGPKDIVTHKLDGYKAKPFNPQSLADGIQWVVSAPNYVGICENARSKVINYFDSEIIAKKYIELYQKALASS